MDEPIWLRTWADARDAFRSRDLRQGLYDEAGRLMEGVIVNLHGDEHRARRRLENRLFRREMFALFEREVIPTTIAAIVAPALTAGSGDLLPLARRTMMKLACVVAGLDSTDDDFDDVFALMNRLARASTAAHATSDRDALRADGLAALAEVHLRFIGPSLARRLLLKAEGKELPRDVLSTLVTNQDSLHLAPDVVVREVAYFPWVGSHSTSNAFVHAMHHLFTWLIDHPDDREVLRNDPVVLQRFVHESLRLHPASPETHRVAESPTVIGTHTIAADQRVIIDMVSANRDPSVWGVDAANFNPARAIPPDASPWGLSFGHGVHACLGMELAGGLALESDPTESHLFGSITTMARALLAHDVRPDPRQPARLDHSTARVVYESYPVLFGNVQASHQTAFAAHPPST